MPYFKIKRDTEGRVTMTDIAAPPEDRIREAKLSRLEKKEAARKNMTPEEYLEMKRQDSSEALDPETFFCPACEFSTGHKPALLSHFRHNHAEEGEAVNEPESE